MNKPLIKTSLIAVLGGIYLSSTDASPNFYVEPTRVVLSNISSSTQINVHNNSDESQIIQVKLKSFLQSNVTELLLESNPEIMGDSQVIITPMIMTVPTQAIKIARFLAINQMESTEIEYRVFISSVSPYSNTSSGASVELGFGLPVYVLPLKITENLQYSIIKNKDPSKYQIKISNLGNTHQDINSVTLLDADNKKIANIMTPGTILPGKYRVFTFPIDKKYASATSFKVETDVQNLVSYTTSIKKVVTAPVL